VCLRFYKNFSAAVSIARIQGVFLGGLPSRALACKHMRGLISMVTTRRESLGLRGMSQPFQGLFSLAFASKRKVETCVSSANRVRLGTGFLGPRGWRLSLAS